MPKLEILGRDEILGRFGVVGAELPDVDLEAFVGREEILGRCGRDLPDVDLEAFVGFEEILGREEILGDDAGSEEILGREEIVGADELGDLDLEAFVGREEILGRCGRDLPDVELDAFVGGRGRRRGRRPKDLSKIVAKLRNKLASLKSSGDASDETRAKIARVQKLLGRFTAIRARSSTSGYDGKWQFTGDSPVVDGLPHPDPLSAEQKEDLRVYLRHLAPLGTSQEADHRRMTDQLRQKYEEVKTRARAGDHKAMKEWQILVRWTNKLQQEALKNDPGSLLNLRQVSRANLFAPRFRVAS